MVATFEWVKYYQIDRSKVHIYVMYMHVMYMHVMQYLFCSYIQASILYVAA